MAHFAPAQGVCYFYGLPPVFFHLRSGADLAAPIPEYTADAVAETKISVIRSYPVLGSTAVEMGMMVNATTLADTR
tara:strand:- start:306 stop:533 length:228 start_codon:yes stop_codon:yes gene_type:complete